MSDLLSGSHGRLQKLLARAQSLQNLSSLVQRLLPSPLDEHCRVANLKNGVLVLHAASPAWAARLRYQTPAILETVRRHNDLPMVRSIEVKVAAPPEPSPLHDTRRSATRPARSLPKDSLAASVGDPEIRRALLRLAGRTPRGNR